MFHESLRSPQRVVARRVHVGDTYDVRHGGLCFMFTVRESNSNSYREIGGDILGDDDLYLIHGGTPRETELGLGVELGLRCVAFVCSRQHDTSSCSFVPCGSRRATHRRSHFVSLAILVSIFFPRPPTSRVRLRPRQRSDN